MSMRFGLSPSYKKMSAYMIHHPLIPGAGSNSSPCLPMGVSDAIAFAPKLLVPTGHERGARNSSSASLIYHSSRSIGQPRTDCDSGGRMRRIRQSVIRCLGLLQTVISPWCRSRELGRRHWIDCRSRSQYRRFRLLLHRATGRKTGPASILALIASKDEEPPHANQLAYAPEPFGLASVFPELNWSQKVGVTNNYVTMEWSLRNNHPKVAFMQLYAVDGQRVYPDAAHNCICQNFHNQR